jgi:NAD(P)-dependent dehydrogenase (short-subunit alcohol dehydrogenase family)
LRVLVVGATGTIGSAIATSLEEADHAVVRASRSNADVRVDLDDAESIRAMYDEVGRLDAVVCAAGVARFGSVQELGDDAYRASLGNKLMGQVHVVRSGLESLSEDGSITLTSGTLSVAPTPGTVAVAMAGAAVEGFVRAAALDLAGRCRVNAVSPGWVAESRVQAGLDPMPGIWARDLARYYRRLVEGDETGAVLMAEEPMT